MNTTLWKKPEKTGKIQAASHQSRVIGIHFYKSLQVFTNLQKPMPSPIRLEIYALDGNSQMLDGGAMFGNCPKALWQKWVSCDSDNRIPLACRSLLIKGPNGYILCEAGIGSFFAPKFVQRFGISPHPEHRLLKLLKELSLTPLDIHTIILSHLHFDHAGGILKPFCELSTTSPLDNLAFPNSRFIISKGALDRALNPHPRDKASYPPVLMETLKALLQQRSQQIELVEPQEHCEDFPLLTGYSTTLGKGFRFIETHGHTPHQLHTLYLEHSSPIFFCSDLVPGIPWLHLPITAGYDRFPEKLINEKQHILKCAVKNRWLLCFTHDHKAAASWVREDENGRFIAKDPILRQSYITSLTSGK